MNLRDLQYVVAVADLRNFSQAAQQCNVSQPTLSGQIKKLEAQLGVTLFERNNKRVMLTESGAHIVRAATHILREANTIEEIAESAKDPLSGKFRLGAFPTVSTYIFPEMVPQVKKYMPDLRLILIEEKTASLIEKLRDGTIDAALLALPIHDDFLQSAAVFDDEFFLAVPSDHELAHHQKINQRTLHQHRLLLLEEGHCLRDQALDVCQLHGINEEQDFKATGLETLRQMVRAGTGITLMPKIAIATDETGIAYIPFESPAPKRTIGLVWRKTTTRQHVIDHITTILTKR